MVNFHPFSYPSNIHHNLQNVYKTIKMVYPSKSRWMTTQMLNSAIFYDKVEIKQVDDKLIILI